MSYAEGTSVPEAQSRIDIEKIIKRHVGREASFTVSSAWKPPPLGGGGNAVRFWVASMSLEW